MGPKSNLLNTILLTMHISQGKRKKKP